MIEQSATQTRRQSSLVDNGEYWFNIEDLGAKQGAVSDEPPLPYDTEIRPPSEFRFEGSLNKLLSLSSSTYREHCGQFLVPGEPEFYEEDLHPDQLGLTAQRGRLLQISTWLDLSNEISVGCAGAIIGYLQRRRSAAYLPDDPSASQAFRVSQFEMFSLRGVM